MDSNHASVNPRNRAMSRLFPKAFQFGHRKSLSFSSSNSSSSSSRCFPEDTSSRSPLSPSTPLRYPSGIPFSWEKLPGIPKRPASGSGRRNDSAASLKLSKLLPLPPPVTSRKHGNRQGEGAFRKKSSPEWDPFVAALVECSKDDDAAGHHHQHDELREEDASGSLWTGAKVSRSVSDRFGFTGLYSSCKRTSAVDESIIYVPRRSSRP